MAKDDTRTAALPFGIVGVDLGTVKREIPADEPPVWPVNAELQVVGKPVERLDGRAKVTGAARYSADVQLPGMLYAARFTSPVPHGRIESIDTSAAERVPGVRAVHVLEQVRGSASLIDPDEGRQPKYPLLRYAGQPIGAVAATSQAVADEAAKLVKIEVEPLPFVAELDAAMKDDAPTVFRGPAVMGGSAGGGGGARGVPQRGNVRGPARSSRGDVDVGLRKADVVVEGEYRTQVQTHSALETHGVVANYKDDELTVYASTQGTKTVREELAHVFGIPKSRVRVITEFMGGGFGAKFGAGNAAVLAVHLSKKTKTPVRLMLNRKEEHLSVGNRPNSIMKVTIGAKKDGTLTAIRHVSHGTAGTGTGAGTSAPARNMYKCDNVLTEDYDVFTNAGPSTAFRAPGHPQGCFSLEQSIDALAEKLGMDPLALRDRIDVDWDAFIDSDARRREREIGAQKIGWADRRAPGADPGPKKRGVGVAQSIWYRIIDMDSAVEVRVDRDGSVALFSGVQDIGTGIRTALAQIVAEELGLRASEIRVVIGDTNHPNGAASGGSKTTGSMTPAARNAAYRAGRRLAAAAAGALGVPAERVRFDGGALVDAEDPSKKLPFAEAAKKLPTEEIRVTASRSPDYGGFERGQRIGIGGMGGVQFAAVEVDTETGVVKVERVVAVHDCGRPVNKLALESQINGGIIQGISYALYEDRLLDAETGKMVNPNLDQYKIVGSMDTPVIEPIVIEQYFGRSSTDVGGIGEPATIPTCAAIANAVYNAIGVRIRELPMTPDVILRALASRRSGAQARRSP
jgi:xanthine dehydrogenase YagR molybdenum-binding subunit